MTDKDFRYTMPDGRVVEAFQMTPATRYQEKQWPDWMSSRYLVTYDHGEERLSINDVETKIPKFGWIVKEPDGAIKAVDYSVMEQADKVVKEEKIAHPRADSGISDEQLAKVHGIEIPKGQKAEDPLREGLAAPADEGSNAKVQESDRDLIHEARLAYELLKAGDNKAAIEQLAATLAKRTSWCNCAPGQCDGVVERWACRKNSPLAS